MGIPKSNRLNQWLEFKDVKERGRSFRGRYFLLGTLEIDNPNEVKVGFITNRKVGNAVKRNLVRRRLRDLFAKHPLCNGFHYVVVANSKMSNASYEELSAEWQTLGKKAGVIA